MATLLHNILAEWLKPNATLEYCVKALSGEVLIGWTNTGIEKFSTYSYLAKNVAWDGSKDVVVFWRDNQGGEAQEEIAAGIGEIPEANTVSIPTAIIANIVLTIANAKKNNVPLFDSVGSVNDIESFIRVADPLKADNRVICGIVEGRVEEATGNNADQLSVCRLSFEIIVRFVHNRNLADTETEPLAKAKELLETIKLALAIDLSRGGITDLVNWNGSVINGTTLNGSLKQLTGRNPNEAFFTASVEGACAWIKYRG